MPRATTKLAAFAAVAGLLVAGSAGVAAGRDGNDDRGHHAGDRFAATLTGYQEVPAVSTRASGTFDAKLDERAGTLTWTLTYRDLEAPVQQAHIHFGQPAVNGGISVFLCSNLPRAPAGVQRCPQSPATITGTATATNVVGPVEQGIEPGALGELVAAMRAGVTYANVHSDKFPNGEIRGQIVLRDRHDGDRHHGDRGDDDRKHDDRNNDRGDDDRNNDRY